jgi:hypothetical protein
MYSTILTFNYPSDFQIWESQDPLIPLKIKDEMNSCQGLEEGLQRGSREMEVGEERVLYFYSVQNHIPGMGGL